MKLLAYCLAENGSGPILRGVLDAEVKAIRSAGATCLFSDIDDLPVHGDELAREGLKFYRVLEAAWGEGSIVPFRFPTFFEDEDDLRNFLREHAGAFRIELERLRGLGELKLTITKADSEGVATSGTEYLRLKHERRRSLETVAATVKAAIAAECREVRESESAQGGWRLLALAPREKAIAISARVAGLTVPAEFSITCSGPFPPSDFVTYNPKRA